MNFFINIPLILTFSRKGRRNSDALTSSHARLPNVASHPLAGEGRGEGGQG